MTALPDRDRLVVDDVHADAAGRLVRGARPFDATSYSTAKYGAVSPFRDYGYRLAELAVRERPHLTDCAGDLTVTGPARAHSPKPAQVIALHFAQFVNLRRMRLGLPELRVADMRHACMGRRGDYAAATPAERTALMAETVDHVDPCLIRNAVVFAIDDALVTGGVEEKMAETLQPLAPRHVCYLYAVRLNFSASPLGAAAEKALNESQRPVLDNISALITAGDFMLNDRSLQLVMSWPDQHDLTRFLGRCPDSFLTDLVRETALHGRRQARQHPDSLNALERELHRRGHPALRMFRRTADEKS